MKLYWSMIPSTDKIRNSFRISIGRQIVFGKFWFYGEYHIWALRIPFPLRSKFCKCPTRYMQYEMGTFQSDIQDVVLTPCELVFLGVAVY